jgi:hypothetical protein
VPTLEKPTYEWVERQFELPDLAENRIAGVFKSPRKFQNNN